MSKREARNDQSGVLCQNYAKTFLKRGMGVKVRIFSANGRATWPKGSLPKRIWKDAGKRIVGSLRFLELCGATL